MKIDYSMFSNCHYPKTNFKSKHVKKKDLVRKLDRALKAPIIPGPKHIKMAKISTPFLRFKLQQCPLDKWDI